MCVPMDLDRSYAESDYVVVAQLTSAKIIDHAYSVGKFEVSEVLKGEAPPNFTLKTHYQTSGSCGIVYWVGASYILFLKTDQEEINRCSGSGKLGDNREVVSWYYKMVHPDLE